ncbi:HlyD family efflux transporter periplasmic adaptor subunit [Flavihumibacter sp. CACIAM 22H1]|uniref:HlyD family secretion protein n=1 Tax=Flavihumibacter sp. CACIAM 22H1 TaxID=1812911 RepID=UPI0007A7C700|nr:HlyD family efflux transporter periplasmic adaptor subunit [Flavihumibacter sp. CACIAM 22H1]KYP14237.1 MAG: biotin attachment protein [Flavihumibacter sp. CACIAM 22H1]
MEHVKETIARQAPGKQFSSFDAVYMINRSSKVKYWMLGVLGTLVVCLFLPWTQNIRSRGAVTTPRQEQRPQELNAIIGGRIVNWHVKEGDLVKKGDTILQLAEVKVDYLDPNLVPRTKEQLTAKQDAVENYKGKITTINQQLVFLKEGLEIKVRELENKIQQQQFKIRSDSMELQAAQNDFAFKQEQYKRQRVLYDSGVASLLSLEQRSQAVQDALAKRTSAEIKLTNSFQELTRLQLELNGERQQYLEKISKAEGERFTTSSQIATGMGDIAKLENLYTSYDIRNQLYYVVAPQDGQVTKARKSGLNEVVKEGEMLVEIVPSNYQYAVEVFVKPVDLPLVAPGQKVRFVFDGFPAIVFSGWPEASYGTFGGLITAVESSVSANGLFRVLVTEDPNDKPWPKTLRMGTGAIDIALLKDVPIWYELWRNINGFPPDYYVPQKTEADGKKGKSSI